MEFSGTKILSLNKFVPTTFMDIWKEMKGKLQFVMSLL